MPPPTGMISPGSSAAWRGVSYVVSAMASMHPATRALTQASNALMPNELPSADALIDAYINGYMEPRTLARCLSPHGIVTADTGWRGVDPIAGTMWRACIQNRFQRADFDTVVGAMFRGIIPKGNYDTLMQYYKVDSRVFPLMAEAYRGQLGVTECMVLNNRQYFNESDATDKIRAASAYAPESIEAVKELCRYIPPPGDLINMTIKGAMNDREINELELGADIEETEEAREWCERQGIGFCRKYDNGVPSDSVDWFNRYWYAHWNLPAPGQVVAFHQRFRANRMHRYKDQIPGIQVFDDAKLDTYMRANDYTPPVRKWLAGLGLSLPRLIDTRNQYFYGIIDRDELIELQLDRGYTRTDAETFAKLADKQKEVWKYRHRVELFDQFDRKLYNEIISAFRVGSISEQEFSVSILGILRDNEAADSVVKAEFLRKQTQVVTSSVASIKSSFFTGEVSIAEAEGRLRQSGVDPAQVDHYISVWELKMTMPRRVRTAAQLTGDFVHGFISILALSQRLQNLGYSQRDTSLALAEALRQQEVFREKEAAKEEKKKGKGKGGTTDAGERWLTPDRVKSWWLNEQIDKPTAESMLAEIDVNPALIPLFFGDRLNGGH